MKVVSIVGARPQFIKMAPVSKVLRERNHEVLVHTGQHYDEEMSDLFFREMGIPEPDHNLGVGSGPHGWQTAQMLAGIEEILEKEGPEIVLIYGDTNSTMAGALAAAKMHIPVAHVEAGLRSYNRTMPEEINRITSDVISDLLFCPTATAVENLAKEGITRGVHRVGDTMYDAILQYKEAAKDRPILDDLGLEKGEFHLLTLHRPRNTDHKENLRDILDTLVASGQTVVFPVHPRTKGFLERYGYWSEYSNMDDLKLIKPLGYLDMVCLLSNCHKLLTDSGGMQKEAYFLQKPCITLRDETEWVETVQDGWNVVVGSDRQKIADALSGFEPEGKQKGHYGDGHASKRIVEILEGF